MNEPLFRSLDEGVAALERDLLAPDGPHISTMRNYRFAILPYRPRDEFKLRGHIRRLTDKLVAEGWSVLPISLQKLLLDRIRATGDTNVEALISRETRLHEKSPERALAHLRDKIAPHIEGDGVTHETVRKAIQTISAAEWWGAAGMQEAILARLPGYRLSKFQDCLPERFALEMVAGYLLDVEGVVAEMRG